MSGFPVEQVSQGDLGPAFALVLGIIAGWIVLEVVIKHWPWTRR